MIVTTKTMWKINIMSVSPFITIFYTILLETSSEIQGNDINLNTQKPSTPENVTLKIWRSTIPSTTTLETRRKWFLRVPNDKAQPLRYGREKELERPKMRADDPPSATMMDPPEDTKEAVTETTQRVTAPLDDIETTTCGPIDGGPDIILEDGKPRPLNPYNMKRRIQQLMFRNFSNVNYTVKVLGKSAEYIDIVMLSMRNVTKDQKRSKNVDKYVEEGPQKKTIFIVHSLDVLGVRSVPCFNIETDFLTLLSFYVANLDKFNILLVPIANPDGYQRTMTDKSWGKNVSPQDECLGVALDYNFDVSWNLKRNVTSCSQSYPGKKPFSEPESRAIREILHFYNNMIVAYIHVHAASADTSIFKGDAVLFPPGNSDHNDNDDKYVDIRGDVEDILKKKGFTRTSVVVDTLNSWYGTVAGKSADYASLVYGIPYSFDFLMQGYEGDGGLVGSEGSQPMSELALRHIWGPVINTIFNSINSKKKTSDEVA